MWGESCGGRGGKGKGGHVAKAKQFNYACEEQKTPNETTNRNSILVLGEIGPSHIQKIESDSAQAWSLWFVLGRPLAVASRSGS